MVKSFTNLEKAGTDVFVSLNLTLAAAVCDQLESAGLPARLGKVDSGFAVVVPGQYAAQSRRLLTAQPRTGEIFF